jgi:hypothetical protein
MPDEAAPSLRKAQDVKGVFGSDRQAVIVIHGIGHQRPMDTLRPFVDAVLGVDPEREQVPQYYSKPDEASATFELRRLQSRESRPRTDYFELYWQHLVPTATWGKIAAWLLLLLRRKRKDVPASLRGLWTFTRVVATAAAILLAASIAIWLFPGLVPATDSTPSDAAYPLGLTMLLLAIQGVVLNYVGDAAIYLSPEPQNIKARQAVREAGVALLERLHRGLDSGHVYDRIVVVGHSLGSVIGYDILTHAWPRFNERHGRPDRPSHDALGDAEAAARTLWDEARPAGTASPSARDESLQKAQDAWLSASRRLWIEQRGNGFPWLVTDFVTLGSPLAHALLLLARNRVEFERKKTQSELPTSPPQLEHKRCFSYKMRYQLKGGMLRDTKVLHHAAVFAVTRWTNLYFPARFGLKGDLIGGAIGGGLGPGIVDLPVETETLGGWLAHTRYWQPHAKDRSNPKAAIARLTDTLDIRRKAFSLQVAASETRAAEEAQPDGG